MASEHRGGRGAGLGPYYLKKRRRALPGEAGPAVVERRGGIPLHLPRPLISGGLRKRAKAPFFWRSLTASLSRGEPVSERRLNGWLLVLAAKKIPHIFHPGGATPRLFVPPLWEGVALHEIRAFEAERPVPAFVPPARDNILGVVCVLFLLLAWHGLRWGWFSFSLPDPPFPAAPREWAVRFGLDVYRFRALHELWRAVTALTLHADDSHLFSNLGFGLLFFIPLCRRAGLGLGFFFAVIAGVFGNIGNALIKDANVLSIGFSTALFGAVGALCALNAADVFRHQSRYAHLNKNASGLVFALARKVLMPLAAGLALLGLLGGGGEARTDYSAHIWGFCCGIAATLALLPAEERLFALPRKTQAGIQAALYGGTLALVAAAWAYALRL